MTARPGLVSRLRDRRADRLLPPARGACRTLAVLAAILGFFAVMALALGLAAHRLAADWQRDLTGTATLQVLAADDEVEAQARAALGVLRATPGVRSVRMIDIDEQQALLEPWLGSQAASDGLPLPLLIEVSSEVGALDLPALRARLAEEAPGAVYDDHATWRAPLVETARAVRRFAGASLGLIALAMLGVAGLATQAATAAASGAIATLRLVGARDGAIAGRVTRPLVLRALAGGAAGSVAGMALLAILPQASEPGFFLAGIGPAGWHRLAPLAVPPAAALLAWIAAGQTVRRALHRDG